MGVRVGNFDAARRRARARGRRTGGTIRGAIAGDRARARASRPGTTGSRRSTTAAARHAQYNLFPNLTVLVFSDMLQVVRSRPGATPDDAYMDAFAFERRPAVRSRRRARSRSTSSSHPTGELPLGLVLNQDFANFARSQRGLHQPGLTHLTVSPTEECRIVNLHRNLEEYLGIITLGAERAR